MTVQCEEANALLSAYLDRELDLLRSLEVERHLDTCGSCAATGKAQRHLSAGLRDPSLVYTPPPLLEQRLRKTVRRETWQASRLSRRWIGIAAAAVLASGVGWGALQWTRPRDTDPLIADLISGQTRSLMAEHLVDVASSDRHTVKPWFHGKLDFSPPVSDFTTEGFPLVGGRLDYIGGRSVAALVYRRRQHAINVFVWPATRPAGAEAISSRGYNLMRWTSAGLTYWTVSDVSRDDLEELARLLRSSAADAADPSLDTLR